MKFSNSLFVIYFGAKRRYRLPFKAGRASYGLGGDFGFSRFDCFVDRMSERFLSTPAAAALGNMFRHIERPVVTVACWWWPG